MTFPLYDTVIIGSGAAGYTSALYAVRYKLKTLVIGNQEGGQSALAHDVENYPGFESIKGPELMQKFKAHAEKYGAEMKADEVKEIIQNEDGTFSLPLSFSGETVTTKTIILAVGTKTRKLGAKGEEKMDGKGVTYCAACDGFFFRNKVTAVMGGGDSAATAALYLAEMCPKVYIFVRKDAMRAEPFWIEQITKKENIEVVFNAAIDEFVGEKSLEKVVLADGTEYTDIAGVFIEIGSDPNTALVEKFGLEKDKQGFLVVKEDQGTIVPGLYAAGDVTNQSNHFHQIATAIGEAAVAANSVFEYVSKGK
ncbi:MAG: FAD-dependent oxidoreductase [Candidatus Peregrinibacteria bacterium]